VFGVAATIAVPLAIELTRKVSGADLLDAVWAIPVAAVAAVLSLIAQRGARGSQLLMTARVLAVAGICFALSSSLAIGIYEFLLWRENHY
jgi:steroid 5-alpha reductase family enzyme